MKNIVLLITLALHFSLSFSQTLFTYGNNAVSQQEFLNAYNKNTTPAENKEKALREYLDLYSKFKLKVKAALDAKLDTLPQVKADLQNFSAQIAESFMTNDNAVNALVEEAFGRMQKDVHVIHFFAPLNSKTTKDDSAKALAAMQELYNNLAGGKNDYDKLLADISAKYLPIKSSDLGFITAFTLPYEYENIIYNLKMGEISKPYSAKNGLHIFKIIDERKAVGKWKIAQILLAFPPDDVDNNKKLTQQKADSIYLKLQAGGNFEELAKQYSDDKLTYFNGGILPEFTTGKFEWPFENRVFKLTKDGEITEPFATKYGYHIVKRISVQPIPSNKNDANSQYEIKQKVLADSRINSVKELFAQSIIKLVGYKKNAAVKDADLFRYADSVAANPAANGAKVFWISPKIIYTAAANNNLKGSDWLSFIREYKTNPELYKGESNEVLLQKFIALKSQNYYQAHLQDYNTNFSNQVKEFKEGNLLFEIMERKVWNTAAKDSAGLLKYYTQNKTKYLWAASADVIIFSCNNKKTAEESLAALKSGKDYKKIVEASNSEVQADKGRYELNQITLPADTQPYDGLITPISVNPTDGTAGFVKIIKLYPANQQRSFDEARGLVINDYQNILEEKWIEELKNKYPIKVDEKVFQSLLQ